MTPRFAATVTFTTLISSITLGSLQIAHGASIVSDSYFIPDRLQELSRTVALTPEDEVEFTLTLLGQVPTRPTSLEQELLPPSFSEQVQEDTLVSLQSLISSLSQLRLLDKTINNNPKPLPILPQVSASEIYEGIYTFSRQNPLLSPSKTVFSPSDPFTFRSAGFAAPPGDPNYVPTLGESRPTLGAIGFGSRQYDRPSGFLAPIPRPSSYSLPSAIPSLALTPTRRSDYVPQKNQQLGINPFGIGQREGSKTSKGSVLTLNSAIAEVNRPRRSGLALLVSPLKPPEYDAEWSSKPETELRVRLRDYRISLVTISRELDQVLDLTLDTDYRLTPQGILPNILDVSLDNEKRSSLLKASKLSIVDVQAKIQAQTKIQLLQDARRREEQQKSFTNQLRLSPRQNYLTSPK